MLSNCIFTMILQVVSRTSIENVFCVSYFLGLGGVMGGRHRNFEDPIILGQGKRVHKYLFNTFVCIYGLPKTYSMSNVKILKYAT